MRLILFILLFLLVSVFCASVQAQDIDVSVVAFSRSVKDIDPIKVDDWITVKEGRLVYDKEKELLTGNVNKSTSKLSWRLVHDGNKVISKYECSGITSTVYPLFVAKTEKEIQDKIKALGLIDDLVEELP